MAEILPRCKRDYPLPPPINRGEVDGLREEKIESKVDKKPASSPVFFLFLQQVSLSPSCSQRLQATLPPARLPLSPPHLFLSIESTSFFLHNGSSPSTPSFSFSSFSSIGSSSTDLHSHNRLYHRHFHQPSSLPATKHTPPVPPLYLLRIFFSFFLPALPPITSSNRRSHHRTTSPPWSDHHRAW